MSSSVGTPATLIQESAGWGIFDADVSSFAGGSVELKFNMTSDTTVNYSGYGIDDVKVTGCCTVTSCPPPGVCTASGCCTPASCDDGDDCTVDTCDPQAGCTHAPLNCSDGNACTDDDCDPLSGCQNPPRSCDDNNACNQDACDPQTGCFHIPGANGVPCDDGYPCTQNDQCQNGFCMGTPVPPPSPVGDTLLLQRLPANVAELTWSAPAGPYNVYRGLRQAVGAWAYDHTCFASMLASPLSTDPSVPPVGGGYYYLVSRKDDCGESVLGYRYPIAPIPNLAPCP